MNVRPNIHRYLIVVCCLLVSATTFSQTLFTYGKDTVTVNEFLQAYRKNNSDSNRNAQALQEYLNLYIASKLKIKEAMEKGYDTLPQLVADMDNLRQQIAPQYLNDPESVKKLTDEAFARSQIDIHLAHIFLSFNNQNGLSDTVAAYKKANEVYKQLKSGASFSDMANQYSDDSSAKTNGGDIGYITVFTLPYELENVVYHTPTGDISNIYKSKSGYHIFKNLSERKAVGTMKAAQILLAFPPDADNITKRRLQKLADSLYDRLQQGADFAQLAAQYSNDIISASAGGVMSPFGVGQYDPVFETAAFSLLKDGAISKPFATSYGYHIVKRIALIPVNADTANKEQMQALQEKILQNDRINTTKAALAEKVKKWASYQKGNFSINDLKAYTDSALDNKIPAAPISIQADTHLFTIDNKSILVNDWITYNRTFRYKTDGSGIRPFNEVWSDFVQTSLLDYYKDHLETFNAAFRQQMTEFKEGNLFFEIMQQRVWNPAQTDTAALLNYYKQHQKKYKWAASAGAVIFYANDAATAQQLYNELKKSPHHWQPIITKYNDKVAADSGRFELPQIPNPTHIALKAGTLTALLINKTDNTASFAYIIQLHPQPAQRTFAEAKSLVINDYQNALEAKWLSELKAKYPVTINEKALAELKGAK